MGTEITETNTPPETTSSTTGYDQYFTEVEEGLNIVAHNIDATCITSSNDNFSLDSDGNLTVNSINITDANNNTLSFEAIMNRLYPVGTIYETTEATNPGELFTGTWEKIEGKFLIGANSTYVLGTTGGTASHTHTMAHTHSRGNLTAAINMDSNYIRSVWSTSTSGTNAVTSWKNNARKTVSGGNVDNSATQSEGTPVYGNTGAASVSTTSSVSNIPPYLAINIWKRIA